VLLLLGVAVDDNVDGAGDRGTKLAALPFADLGAPLPLPLLPVVATTFKNNAVPI
jgi:hypothetical protein